MSWAAIEGFRKWTAKRRRLLQGLLGIAVDGVASCVPGGAVAVWSTRIVGEFAKHGVDRLADTAADVPDVKPSGHSFSAEQLDQLNGWLASLSASYADLLDRLDSQVALPAEASDEQLSTLVRQALSQHTDLAREFDAHAEEVRRQTLSLARIEERLDEIFHGQQGIALSLEEIKAFLLQCAAPPGEWEAFRRARPESVRLLNEADALFLAGRREEGRRRRTNGRIDCRRKRNGNTLAEVDRVRRHPHRHSISEDLCLRLRPTSTGTILMAVQNGASTCNVLPRSVPIPPIFLDFLTFTEMSWNGARIGTIRHITIAVLGKIHKGRKAASAAFCAAAPGKSSAETAAPPFDTTFHPETATSATVFALSWMSARGVSIPDQLLLSFCLHDRIPGYHSGSAAL